MFVEYFSSPLGLLLIEANERAVRRIHFGAEPHTPPRGNTVTRLCRQQLDEYFAGARRVFDLPLEPTGTPFQQQVWRQLRAIDFGATDSYAAVAARVGRPRAVRAVGAANGANPLAIVVPCHRVIGSNGKLTGYAGGLERKAWLLRHEGACLL